MGLKDNAGLVKEYALVDAVEYQNVIVATTVESYSASMPIKTTLKLTMQPQKVSRVWWQTSNQLLSRGDTVYFFKVDGKIYKVKASVSDDLPYLENGKTFEVK